MILPRQTLVIACGCMALLTATSATIAVRTPPRSEAVTVSVDEIHDANTATIAELGKVAELLYQQADIMARFSHYTDGHTKQTLFCPECGGESKLPPEPEHYDDVDTKPDQDLMGDAAEIQRSLQVFQAHLSGQLIGLKYTLKRLREGAAKRVE